MTPEYAVQVEPRYYEAETQYTDATTDAVAAYKRFDRLDDRHELKCRLMKREQGTVDWHPVPWEEQERMSDRYFEEQP